MTILTLQPDATAGIDAHIYSFNSTTKATNYGNATTISMGFNGAGQYLPLIFFNVSSIPAYSTINSATLTLYQSSGNAGTVNIDVRAILQSWAESTVTWNNQPTMESTGITSALTPVGTAQYKSIDVKALVQRWVNGELTNNGLTIISSESYCVFASSDGSTPAQRPKLVVDWSPFNPIYAPVIPSTMQTNTAAISPDRDTQILAALATAEITALGQRFALCFLDEQGNWKEASVKGNMNSPINFGQVLVGNESPPLKLALKTAFVQGQDSVLITPGGDKPQDLAMALDNSGVPATWTGWGNSMTLPILNKQGYNTFFVKTRAQIGEQANSADASIQIIVSM